MRKYRVKNRKRFLFSVSLMIIFTLMISFTLIVNAKDINSAALVPVYVQKGDTLWGLSAGFAGNEQDIRDYINTVMEINKIGNANIVPGELIYFPDYNWLYSI